jgi:hypothetical protein
MFVQRAVKTNPQTGREDLKKSEEEPEIQLYPCERDLAKEKVLEQAAKGKHFCSFYSGKQIAEKKSLPGPLICYLAVINQHGYKDLRKLQEKKEAYGILICRNLSPGLSGKFEYVIGHLSWQEIEKIINENNLDFLAASNSRCLADTIN